MFRFENSIFLYVLILVPVFALLYFLLRNYRIPKVRLDGFRIPPHLKSAISSEIVRRYRVIPIDLVGDILCVAVADIYSLPADAVTEIRKATGYRVKVFAGDAANIARLLGVGAPESAGHVLKPRRANADALRGLARVSGTGDYCAAAFHHRYLSAGPLKPISVCS